MQQERLKENIDKRRTCCPVLSVCSFGQYCGFSAVCMDITMENKLSPSILAADFTRLGEEIKHLDNGGADFIHIDVMDGTFVPSISFGVPVIEKIRSLTELVFDVHLMVEEPFRYLKDFQNAGADIITVHVECCRHLHRTVAKIKELGLKAGVALNPATSLTTLDYILEDIDMVLIMSVNPGFGGQDFIPSTFTKLKELKERITEKQYKVDIEVDGGIRIANARKVLESGANVLVAGTAIFQGEIQNNIKKFKEVFNHVSLANETGQATGNCGD